MVCLTRGHCRELFDISLAYESEPSEKNFKAIHNFVGGMSGEKRLTPQILLCTRGPSPVKYLALLLQTET